MKLKVKAIKDQIIFAPYQNARKSRNGLILPSGGQQANEHAGQMSYMVGRVVSAGEDVTSVQEGDLICLSAHSYLQPVRFIPDVTFGPAEKLGEGLPDVASWEDRQVNTVELAKVAECDIYCVLEEDDENS